MDMSMSKLREMVMDRKAWHAGVHGAAMSWTWLSDWTAATAGIKYCMFTKENTECLGSTESADSALSTCYLVCHFQFCSFSILLLHAWLKRTGFQEEKHSSRLPSVTLVMNAGDLSVGGEVGSPGVLPGGSMRSRSCPASPLPSLLSPVSCLYSLPALEKAEQGSNIEAASKLRVWLIAVSSYITGLPVV